MNEGRNSGVYNEGEISQDSNDTIIIFFCGINSIN